MSAQLYAYAGSDLDAAASGERRNLAVGADLAVWRARLRRAFNAASDSRRRLAEPTPPSASTPGDVNAAERLLRVIHLRGPPEAPAARGPSVLAELARLRAEHAELRAANRLEVQDVWSTWTPFFSPPLVRTTHHRIWRALFELFLAHRPISLISTSSTLRLV